MAYVHADGSLARIGGQNSDAPTLWTYKTNDAAAVVQVEDYFLAAAEWLTVGDCIIAYVDADGTPGMTIYTVNQNDGTNVDVVDGTAVTQTDSD